MNNSKLLQLFSTGVTITEVGGLTFDELKLIKSFDTKPGVFNDMSIDHRILEHPGLERVKSLFEECFSRYMYEVLLSENDVSPSITQSWLNYTKLGQKHKSHYHSNSFLSAVFYVQTDDKDSMEVYKTLPNVWYLFSKEFNEFNSVDWSIPAKQGSIIVFPSELTHEVGTKETNSSTRISLACNMIPSGTIGDETFLNLLEL